MMINNDNEIPLDVVVEDNIPAVKVKRVRKSSTDIKTFGSKRDVFLGLAKKTRGGLFKDDLMMNKQGKIVSKKKHQIGLKMFQLNNLKPKSAEEMAELRSRKGKKIEKVENLIINE